MRMYERECEEIFKRLHDGLPAVWDGKTSILYMKSHECTQWRQMEWPGFYFQFMCEQILGNNDFFKIPGPKYDNVVFDGFRTIPWDFKAHCNGATMVPTNGYAEICQALDEYGTVGFIIICGNSEYDDNQSFKAWHDALKGGTSAYELERIKRNATSRRRKVNFAPTELVFAFVNKENIGCCGKFQEGMRNADGTPRNPKVMLDLKSTDLHMIRYKF